MSTVKLHLRSVWFLLLSSLCTPIVLLSWGAIRNGVDIQHGAMDIVRSTASGFIVYGSAAEVVTAVLGLPAYVLVRRYRISSWSSYVSIGALISQLVNLVLSELGTLYFLTGQPSKWQAFADAIPAFLLCGVLSSLAFRALNGPAVETY